MCASFFIFKAAARALDWHWDWRRTWAGLSWKTLWNKHVETTETIKYWSVQVVIGHTPQAGTVFVSFLSVSPCVSPSNTNKGKCKNRSNVSSYEIAFSLSKAQKHMFASLILTHTQREGMWMNHKATIAMATIFSVLHTDINLSLFLALFSF